MALGQRRVMPPFYNLTVAVCITGALRDHFDPVLQYGFTRNLHWPGYDYFLSAENTSSLQHAELNYVDVFDDNNGRHFVYNEPDKFKGATDCYGSQRTLPMVVRYLPCMTMILTEERRRAFRYDYVARVRPDAVFKSRLPPLPALYSAVRDGADVVLWDDHIGMSTRAFASTLFVTPTVAYQACLTKQIWHKACGPARANKWFDAVESGMSKMPSAPCCPMLTLRAFEPDVSFKECGFPWEPICMPQPCSIGLLHKRDKFRAPGTSGLSATKVHCSATPLYEKTDRSISTYCNSLRRRRQVQPVAPLLWSALNCDRY